MTLNSGSIRSGIPNLDGMVRQPANLPATEANLAKLHARVLHLVGGSRDQAFRGTESDFEAIQGLPLFQRQPGCWPLRHLASPKGGFMGAIAIDWLTWQLKDEQCVPAGFQG